MISQANLFQRLPSVDKVLQSPALKDLRAEVGHDSVKLQVQHRLEMLRQSLAANDSGVIEWLASPDFSDELCEQIVSAVRGKLSSSLVPVFNLTGTVIHTNLGRAGLPAEAIAAMHRAAVRPLNLEYDLESGARGDRDSHIEHLACEFSGAEAATVVNNNAAAVVLILNTLALHKEAILSRGELVEIGGAFRIPDVMESASCHLREVGTTNRTHLSDYAKAINDNTAVLMKVHTSNYEIKGFTNSVSESELATLAHEHALPFVADLGSGTLIDMSRFNLPKEMTVRDVVEAGADLVCFSGDKLLGGPQAGLIVGRRDLVDRIKRNPLKRALRVDKITLAGLEAVLQLYRDPDSLAQKLPILMDLTRPQEVIAELAERILPALQVAVKGKAEVSVAACQSQIGSGALPLDLLSSHALVLTPVAEKGATEAALKTLSMAFRHLPQPVIGRLQSGTLAFDLRCLRDEEVFLAQLDALSL